jgi:hypothetical protein
MVAINDPPINCHGATQQITSPVHAYGPFLAFYYLILEYKNSQYDQTFEEIHY